MHPADISQRNLTDMNQAQPVAYHLPEEFRSVDIVQEMSTVGVFAIDRRFNILLWNRFMEVHSQIKAESLVGKNLLEAFPELNEVWLERKLKSVMVLRSQSYTSWRQRPYVLRFPNVQAVHGDCPFMYQDCSFWPLRDREGQVHGVCVSVHDVTEIAMTQQLLEHATESALNMEEISQRDALTGIYNRSFFDVQLSQEMTRARRYNWDMALMMIDIDHFKVVNDTYGHQGGDEVLRVVAMKLLQQLRASDTLCRYGGEEFVLILPQVNAEKVPFVAERLRKAVAQEVIVYQEHRVSVTISIGVTLLQQGMTPGQLILWADRCLYDAKQNGRNRVVVYLPEPALALEEDMALASPEMGEA